MAGAKGVGVLPIVFNHTVISEESAHNVVLVSGESFQCIHYKKTEYYQDTTLVETVYEFYYNFPIIGIVVRAQAKDEAVVSLTAV